jgi:hypothetical protein
LTTLEAIKKYLTFKGYQVDKILLSKEENLHVLVHPYPSKDIQQAIRHCFGYYFIDRYYWEKHDWKKIKQLWKERPHLIKENL